MRFRRALSRTLLIVGFAIWIVPGNVPRLILRWDEVVLGRYGAGHFTGVAIAALVLWLLAYAARVWDRRGAREAVFRLLAITGGVAVACLAAEIGGRIGREARYVEKPATAQRPSVTHRPPDRVIETRYVDAPMRARSYPNPPSGYPAQQITFTTDRRGYRNTSRADRWDVVAVGDSFTEGNQVSDADAWPARLGRSLGRPVYNLGISGGDLSQSLRAIRAWGVELHPRLVILMLYEGNDFQQPVRLEPPESGRRGTSRDWTPRFLRGESPIKLGYKRVLLTSLAQIGAEAPVRGWERFAWMPLALPEGPAARFYAFRPRRLTRLSLEREHFERSELWSSIAAALRAFRDECDRIGAGLILAYAPSKPRVVMPAFRGKIAPEDLAAFASYSRDRTPIPGGVEIYDRLDSLEEVVGDFARREGIAFVSSTEKLREGVRQGRQVYYTYDQHWTPLGHEDAAELLLARVSAFF